MISSGRGWLLDGPIGIMAALNLSSEVSPARCLVHESREPALKSSASGGQLYGSVAVVALCASDVVSIADLLRELRHFGVLTSWCLLFPQVSFLPRSEVP